jgi:hypothetical protein
MGRYAQNLSKIYFKISQKLLMDNSFSAALRKRQSRANGSLMGIIRCAAGKNSYL